MKIVYTHESELEDGQTIVHVSGRLNNGWLVRTDLDCDGEVQDPTFGLYADIGNAISGNWIVKEWKNVKDADGMKVPAIEEWLENYSIEHDGITKARQKRKM